MSTGDISKLPSRAHLELSLCSGHLTRHKKTCSCPSAVCSWNNTHKDSSFEKHMLICNHFCSVWLGLSCVQSGGERKHIKVTGAWVSQLVAYMKMIQYACVSQSVCSHEWSVKEVANMALLTSYCVNTHMCRHECKCWYWSRHCDWKL